MATTCGVLRARFQTGIAQKLSEQCGVEAANNWVSLKKTDLALAMADRLAEKDWLPPMLVIAPESINGELEKTS